MLGGKNGQSVATVANGSTSSIEEIMAKFHVTVRANKSSARPHLKFVVDCKHPTKGRVRIYRQHRIDADTEADALRTEVENFGIRALELSGAQRIEALDAFEKLKPFGVTLGQVIRDYVDRHGGKRVTVAEITEAFLKSRVQKKRSDRHIDGVKGIFAKFNQVFGARAGMDLTTMEIQSWLDDQEVGGTTRNHYRAVLHSAFEYAVRYMKALKENPLRQIEPESVKTDRVAIFTGEQMKKLLIAAKDEPDVLVTLALGAFAGIRPDEVGRTVWSAINFETGVIDVPAKNSKTSQHRYVTIEPNLRLWIEGIWRKHVLNHIKIQGPNFRRRWDDVRKAAGYSVRASAGLKWPHDGLRHSFASYHYARNKNAEKTAFELGHQDTTMLFKNYRARVSEADAIAWSEIKPGISK